VAHNPRDNTAAYLANWLAVLKNDKRPIIRPLRRRRPLLSISQRCSQPPDRKPPSPAVSILFVCSIDGQTCPSMITALDVCKRLQLTSSDGSLFAGGGQ
jgi:hypothetical protein